MSRSRYYFVFVVALTIVIASGCRTYGGYGVQEKTYEAMQTTVQSFESELERVEADLRRLKEAADEKDGLTPLVRRYSDLVHEHETLLHTQRRRVERLSPESDPRSLRTAYGATVTERRMLEQQYQRVIRKVQGVVQTNGSMISGRSVAKSNYSVTPTGFPREQRSDHPTMEQALRGL